MRPYSIKPATDRFNDKWVPEPNSGCWLWTASCNPYGYGSFNVGGNIVHAHRFSYKEYVGEIPDGLQIDHLCRTRSCVNPNHLEAVTPRENIMRGEGLAAKCSKQTHCIHGHSFSGRNLVIGKKQRFCRICDSLRHKKQRLKRKELKLDQSI